MACVMWLGDADPSVTEVRMGNGLVFPLGEWVEVPEIQGRTDNVRFISKLRGNPYFTVSNLKLEVLRRWSSTLEDHVYRLGTD